MNCLFINIIAFCLLIWVPLSLQYYHSGKVAKPGPIPCIDDSGCSNGKCINGECICEENQLCPLKTTSRRNNQTRTNNCNETPCPEFASCINDLTCTCNNGYVMSTNNSACLPIKMNYEDDCEETRQCKFENTKCDNKQCVCAEGYLLIDETCVKIGFIGTKSCSQTKDCEGLEDAQCIELSKKCNCESTKVPNQNRTKCIDKIAKPGGECVKDSMCESVENQKCIDETCQCPENQHVNQKQTQCIPTKNLGEPCTNSDECYFFDSEQQKNALTCDQNCTCANDYILTGEENNQTCTYSGSFAITFNCMLIFFTLHLSTTIIS